MAEAMLQSARNAFASGRTLKLSFRRQQLKGLLRMLDVEKEGIVAAVNKDLRKSTFEAVLFEIEAMKADIQNIHDNLKNWTSDADSTFNLLTMTDSSYVHKDPFGVVLIIGTWNYPFAMVLQPLAGAIAAGNVAILKPSEMAPASSSTMAEIVPKYLDPDCYKVFLGDVDQTIHLLTLKFDFIFYTGSGNVGKSIMESCAKSLTPCCLELGGKSPVYIDDAVDIENATKRILWGKVANCGQTCIAPDYILLSKKQQQAFLNAASKILADWLGENWQQSDDMARIINGRHFNRLKKLLDSTKGRVALGGQTDEKDLYFAPTIVVDVDPEVDVLMADEIFGPILPLVVVDSPEAAIKFISSRPKPLALYVFSNRQNVVQQFVNRTSSGGVCINDVIFHNAWEGLPFGGVGPSGMGNYHGKYSIDTFSHKKAVLSRSLSAFSEKLSGSRYLPYTNGKLNFLTFAMRQMGGWNVRLYRWRQFASHLLAAALGAAIVVTVVLLR